MNGPSFGWVLLELNKVIFSSGIRVFVVAKKNSTVLVCLHYYLLSCNVVNIVDLFLLLLLLLLLFYLLDVVKNVIASLFYFVFC